MSALCIYVRDVCLDVVYLCSEQGINEKNAFCFFLCSSFSFVVCVDGDLSNIQIGLVTMSGYCA